MGPFTFVSSPKSFLAGIAVSAGLVTTAVVASPALQAALSVTINGQTYTGPSVAITDGPVIPCGASSSVSVSSSTGMPSRCTNGIDDDGDFSVGGLDNGDRDSAPGAPVDCDTVDARLGSSVTPSNVGTMGMNVGQGASQQTSGYSNAYPVGLPSGISAPMNTADGTSFTSLHAGPVTECNDGIDNDGDGCIDMGNAGDASCTASDSEYPPNAACYSNDQTTAAYGTTGAVPQDVVPGITMPHASTTAPTTTSAQPTTYVPVLGNDGRLWFGNPSTQPAPDAQTATSPLKGLFTWPHW